MSGYDQLDPNITALYDIPSFLPNSTGRLRSDKPYQFKMDGAYTFPWGLTVSEGFLLSAGVPVSTQGPEIVNGYGDGTIFLQPRGSAGRTPTYWNVDFHADYRLPLSKLGRTRNISVILDVFNLFNRNAVLERDSDYVYEGMDGIEAWQAESNLDAFGNPKFNPSLPASPHFNTPIRSGAAVDAGGGSHVLEAQEEAGRAPGTARRPSASLRRVGSGRRSLSAFPFRVRPGSAILQQGHDGADRGQHRREQGADDARAEGNSATVALVLNHDAAHVAFVNQIFQLVEDVRALGLARSQ